MAGTAARFLGTFALVLSLAAAAAGLERVTLRRGGKELQIAGQLLVKAEDGGLLIKSPDGRFWTVPPDEIVSHASDQVPFEPFARDQCAKRLLAELPAGFEVHQTTHYLICHNTSRAYAQWCGSLFERLYGAFTNYWTRKGFALHEPEFPLVALVFADHDSYVNHAAPELGDGVQSIIGYYSFQTNRMTMYDLSGIQALRQPGDRRGSALEINQMLARPEAERTVATIIHEATHQIAFNCGLQTRYSDVPLWVSEGIAVYFETPDLSSAKGWRNIGGVNTVRLAGFRQYLPRRAAGSLATLIADDKRLRDPRQAADAYSEAWALNYFLIHHRAKQYEAYVKMLSAKSQLIWDKPEGRLKEFRKHFGEDLDQLDAEFLRQMNKMR